METRLNTHLVECAQLQSYRGVDNKLAVRPPAALLACNTSTASAIRPLGVNIYRVDTCPSAYALDSINWESSARQG